ncbi:hypothetical protein BGZ67_010716, partial [Mortierella alpina]
DIAASNNVPQAARAIATKTVNKFAAIHESMHESRASALSETPRPSASAQAATPKPLHRDIYNAHGRDDLPGRTKVYCENGSGAPSTIEGADKSAKNVHEHFQKVFDFYQSVFKRNSYDGEGAKLTVSVHYDGDPSPGFNNAFWFGDPNFPQFAYGDGDYILFDNFTNILDITGHEFTHAVTDSSAILPYRYLSGALNESFSDVFGSMIKQFFAPGGQQKAQDADWLIGEGLWLSNAGPRARALRDMANPGTAFDIPGVTRDRQTGSMIGYQELSLNDDQGGVHIFSGVPNRAFVLAAKALGGFSWEVAGPIWYASLTDPELRKIFCKDNGDLEDEQELKRLAKDFKFETFADLTIKHAAEHGPKAVAAVKNAWSEVGV